MYIEEASHLSIQPTIQVSISYVPPEHFCKPDVLRGNILWMHQTSRSTFLPLCERAGGRLPIPEQASRKAIVSLGWSMAAISDSLEDPLLTQQERYETSWHLGMRQVPPKGVWKDDGDNLLGNFTGYLSKPLNPAVERGSLLLEGRVLHITHPNYIWGKGACLMNNVSVLPIWLKGLCKMESMTGGTDNIDREYYYYGTRAGFPHMR